MVDTLRVFFRKIPLHDRDKTGIALGLELAGAEVAAVVLIVDRKGRQMFAAVPQHVAGNRGNQTGVQPTRQKGANRYITDQLAVDGIQHQ